MARASGLAMSLGVWVFILWAWFSVSGRGDRGEVLALGGLILGAAFVGGWLGSALVGERGLSSLGALVGAGAALLCSPGGGRLGRLGRVDIFAGPGLAALGIARMGCFFAGCDFGRPTSGGWGVIYGRQTRAWETQVFELGLSVQSEQSAPVHLFALYLGAWGLFSAVAAEVLRRRGLRRGQAGFFGAGLFFAGGGIIEYTREPSTVVQLSEGVSIYPSVYFLFALVSATAGFYLARWEPEASQGRV